MKKTVFLDRDGVINNNANHYYIFKPEQLEINPDAIENIVQLNRAGYLVIVVSNQGGISRGLYSSADVDKIHELIQAEVERQGGHIANFYYCPHHSKLEKCLCRKPEPLMLQKAIAVHHVDMDNAFMIGDSQRDIEAANRAGIKAFQIESNTSVGHVVEKILRKNGKR